MCHRLFRTVKSMIQKRRQRDMGTMKWAVTVTVILLDRVNTFQTDTQKCQERRMQHIKY